MPQDQDEFIPTRKSLLSRLKDWQDQASWRDFFNTYWKLIYGVAMKAGLNDAQAQEVVQETMISVAKKMPDFKYDPSVGTFKAWLFTITERRINDHFRKRGSESVRHAAVELASGDSGGTSETPLENRIADPASVELKAAWDQDWERNLMDVALEKVKRQVDPRQYQMFDLYVIKEWSAQKVATTLRAPLPQVYYAKYKLTALLRKEVKRLEKKMR